MNIDLLEQLKKHEGYRSHAYQDTVGIWTVGYGRNLQAMTVSNGQAESWLREDILEAELDLMRNFPMVHGLSPNRQKVLINMTFNLGITGLTKFKKMWLALYDGDYEEVCDQMKDSKWYNQVGLRAKELIKQMRKG